MHEPVPAGPPPASRLLQTVLLAVVVLLTLTLGVVTYWRFGSDAGGAAAAGETTTTTIAAGATTSATTAPTTVDPSGPTSVVPPDSTTTTTTAPATSSTTAPIPGGPPAPPANVELVEIGPNSARIEWTSEECVGSRYQVGDFAEGGGGYPNVDRCWTDHVVLAGDPSFSPLLTPDTEYVVRIHAVGRDGQVSEPRFITIRTTSG